MRVTLGSVIALFVLNLSHPTQALDRSSRGSGPFFERTAFSGSVELGFPIGDFGDEQQGNHKNGFGWNLSLEHFVDPEFSLGLTFATASFEDDTFGDDLVTELLSFGVFLRYVFIQDRSAHPYLKFGLSSMEVEFESVELLDPDDPSAGAVVITDDAENKAALVLGAGVMLLVGESVVFDAGVGYTRGFTDDAAVGYFEEDGDLFEEVVGFDVEYFSFNFGVAVLFP